MRFWEQLIAGKKKKSCFFSKFQNAIFGTSVYEGKVKSTPKKGVVFFFFFFHKQDWKNTKRKNHGLAAAPSDSVEQILHLHAASLLASLRKEPRRRGGRPQSRTAQTARRLQGKQSISNWKLLGTMGFGIKVSRLLPKLYRWSSRD